MATAPRFEWHTMENEEEWSQLTSATQSAERAAVRFHRWEVLLVLVVLLGASGRWYQARSRVLQTESELAAAVQRDTVHEPVAAQDAAVDTAAGHDPSANIGEVAYAPQAYTPQAEDSLAGTPESETAAYQDAAEVRRFEVHGDQAVVYANTPMQRQTLFYSRAETGWQQTAPNPALWGPAHSLSTDTFIYHFQEKDAAVMDTVAPQIEAVYAEMRATLGLAEPATRGKTVVEVSLTQHTWDNRLMTKIAFPPKTDSSSSLPHTYYHVLVASPARYVAPAGVTDAELLAQSILLPLALQVTSEAVRTYQLEWLAPEETRIAQVLYLWQLWDLDLPLAAWREEVVRWRLHELSQLERDQAPPLPTHYAELCAAHRLWLASPRELGIPLTCSEADTQPLYWAAANLSPLQVDPLLAPLFRRAQTPDGEHYWIDWYGDVMALATLLEYVVDEYGREQLPAFLKEVAHHRSLNTFTLQVFGVSPGEFEASWQDYLHERYDFSGTQPIPES